MSPGSETDPTRIDSPAGEPPSEPHFRVARQRLEQRRPAVMSKKRKRRRHRKHWTTGHATYSIITRPWHRGPLSMVDLGRVDATILIGDGVRLNSVPDSNYQQLMTPTGEAFLRWGFASSATALGKACPRGLLARLRCAADQSAIGCVARADQGFVAKRCRCGSIVLHLRFDCAPVRRRRQDDQVFRAGRQDTYRHNGRDDQEIHSCARRGHDPVELRGRTRTNRTRAKYSCDRQRTHRSFGDLPRRQSTAPQIG